MKVTFIHEVSYRTKFVFEMHEFPELFALNGDDISFIEYPEDEESWFPKTAKFKELVRGRAYPESLIKVSTPASFGKGIFARFFSVFFSVPLLIQHLRSRPDVIVLYAVPTTGWQTVFLAKLYKIPVVFRALDVSHKLRPTIFSKAILLSEKYIYRNATIISANNIALGDYCKTISQTKVPVLVNLPPLDLSHFHVDYEASLESFGVPKHSKVIMYMGTFFRFSGLSETIRYFHKVQSNFPDVYLVLVGGGEIEHSLRELVIQLGMTKKIIFTGRIDYKDLNKVLSSANVAINPFESNLITNVALPHKILQYLACGIPVISTNLSGIRGTLGEKAGVIWVENNVNVMEVALKTLQQSTSQLEILGLAGRERVSAIFNKGDSLESFQKSLKYAIQLNNQQRGIHE